MSPENESLARRICPERFKVHDDYNRLTGDLDALMNAVRAEERARADTITPAMIQAAQDRVQGPDEDMYSAIYRAMRSSAVISNEWGA